MSRVPNGIPAGHLAAARWHKSSRSQGASNCVEFAALPDGQIAVRNSRHPGGPALVYTRDDIAALLADAKAGELDQLTT